MSRSDPVSNILDLPFVKLNVHTTQGYIGELCFLADSGAVINCVQTSLVSKPGVNILPTTVQPVGVNGQPLTASGEVVLRLKYNDDLLGSGRFVLIDHLPFQGILGANFLGDVNFGLTSNKSLVHFGTKVLQRVAKHDELVPSLTTISNFQAENQIFVIMARETKILLETDSVSIDDLDKEDSEVADRGHTVTTGRPQNTSRNTCDENTDSTVQVDEVVHNITDADVCDEGTTTLVPETALFGKEVRANTSELSGSSDEDNRSSKGSDFGWLHTVEPTRIKDLMMETTITDEQHARQLYELLLKFEESFSIDDDDIGLFKATDGGPSTVTLSVKDPTVFNYAIPRRVPYSRREWLQSKLEKWCKNGIIEEVTIGDRPNLQTSPIVIVPKKGLNRYRMAVDYREVNKNLNPATHPMPNVRDCVEEKAGMTWFTSIDFTSAFNQVGLCEESKDLLGFVTLNRRFLTHRLPYGANPCPGLFQEVIGRCLRDVPDECCCAYLDDILIYSRTFEEHLEHISTVLSALSKHNMKISPKKSKFARDHTGYLGYIIGKTPNGYGYCPNPGKVEAIRNMPLPRTAKEVRPFAGSLQFYNQMIPRLNIMLSSLHKGASKKPFEMTEEMIESFHLIKEKLADKILLTFPNFDLPFKLTTDASYSGASGVLTQIKPDGNEEIIFLFSKTFSDTETRWSICELECLALVWSLEKMRVLLLGRRFIWVTDSKVLMQMLQNPPKDLSRTGRKISRFVDVISAYDIEMQHQKGTEPPALLADFLSRAPVTAIETLFRAQMTREEWVKAVSNDEDLMARTKGWSRYKNDMFIEDSIVYVDKHPKCKLAVPMSLQNRLVKYYHEKYTIHGGTSRLISLISPLYIFPDMFATIRKYVRACPECIKTKKHPMQLGISKDIEIPSRPGEWLVIDLVSISPEPSVAGNRYVLTTACRLTNFLQCEPIPSKEAIVVLRALCRVFCRSGVPNIIQSDNGKEFQSSIVQSHAKWLGINWRFSVPYKPSTNGLIERKHQEMSKLLRLLQSTKRTWDDELPYVQFEMNVTTDRTMMISPHEAFHGWAANIPHLLKEINLGTPSTQMSWENQIRKSQERTFDAIKEQRKNHQEQFAMSTPMQKQLVPGDHVMVRLPVTGKLQKKLQGPFEITKITPGGSFKAFEIDGKKNVTLPASKAVRIKHLKEDMQTEIMEHSVPMGDDMKSEHKIVQPKPEVHADEHLDGRLINQRPKRSKTKIDYSKFY